MRVESWPLAALFLLSLLGAEESGRLQAPSYSAASIVNAATNLPGALAPNTIATIYGENLAYVTRAISPSDLDGDRLPTRLPGTGVSVLVRGIPASIYYVSPRQINLLIPGTLLPGRATLQVSLDGRAGAAVEITLNEAAPALFQLDLSTAIATKGDGSLISWDEPAMPGEIIVLYGTGLGQTLPDFGPGEIPRTAAPIKRLSELKILLDAKILGSDRLAYAGVAPGYAGLYQINFWLPENVGADPEVRIAMGDDISPPGIQIPVAVLSGEPSQAPALSPETRP